MKKSKSGSAVIVLLVVVVIILLGITGFFFYKQSSSAPKDAIILPAAQLGKAYSYQILGPISLVSGKLPDGMYAGHEALPCAPSAGNCDSNYYAIFGTPKKLGTYDFRLQFSADNTVRSYELGVY